MSEVIVKLWMGRKVKEEKIFEASGTFAAFNNAEYYLNDHGYDCGSMDKNNPIGFVKGNWSFPNKWHSLRSEQKLQLAGVMVSEDFRTKSVKVVLFEQKTIL